jgi:hypothetical protein
MIMILMLAGYVSWWLGHNAYNDRVVNVRIVEKPANDEEAPGRSGTCHWIG